MGRATRIPPLACLLLSWAIVTAHADPAPGVAILRTSTVHQSTEFRLDAGGVGLASIAALDLVATDGSWRQPLRIVSRDDTTITATAALAAHVPACTLEARSSDGSVVTAEVFEDPLPPELLLPEANGGCAREFGEFPDTLDPWMLQPGNFAMVAAWTPTGAFASHLFYGRTNQRLPLGNTRKNLGHAVSADLVNWTVVDTAAVRTRGGRFDSLRVWSPTIVLDGLTYHMFYTGTDQHGDQRIGLATSADLVTWVQGDSVLEVGGGWGDGHVFWADSAPGGRYSGARQLHDPFVMRDPERPGCWLMYYATVSRQYSPQGVIGVARSSGNLHSWSETFPLWNTAHSAPSSLDTTAVESPSMLHRNGKWWLLWTVAADEHPTWAVSSRYGPIDTLGTGQRWAAKRLLRSLVPPMQSMWFYCWTASECLQLNNQAEFFAGVCTADVSIRYAKMLAVSDTTLLFQMNNCDSMTVAVGESPRPSDGPRLSLAGANPARSRVPLGVELPSRMPVHVAVYDVAGRRIQTIVDGELPAGRTALAWDGRDASGVAVGSGAYFARLTTARGRETLRVVLLR
jgi:hypothetical protein